MIEWSPIRVVVRAVLPRSGGYLAVLSAYFDDSGTHEESPVVVYGGLIGLDSTWARLESDWSIALEKYRIPYFHLAEATAPDGIFRDWNRAQIDMAVGEFRSIILSHDLWGVSASVVRSDWDELVRGDLRKSIGEADEFCALMCLHDAMTFNTRNGSQKSVAVAFDKRINRSGAISARLDHMLSGDLYGISVSGLSFVDMKSTLPMQAADMVATETYWNAQEWLSNGGTPTTPSRDHFQRFLEGGKLMGGIAGREAIGKIIELERLGPFWPIR